jgi:quercetin dioxygenase-like cupin family protein
MPPRASIGLAGPVQFCAAITAAKKPVQWYTLPPLFIHWHGAAAATAMSHIAIQEKFEGSPVDWLEQVSDADYGSAAAAVTSG